MKTLKDLKFQVGNEKGTLTEPIVVVRELKEEIENWIKTLKLEEAWNWYNLKDSGHCMARNVRASDKPKRKLTKEESELIFGITPRDGILLLQRLFNIKEV